MGALAPERWAEVGAKARVAWMGVLVPVAVALEVAATVPASQEVGVAIAASQRAVPGASAVGVATAAATMKAGAAMETVAAATGVVVRVWGAAATAADV